jgi:hypothetical protein
LPEDQEEGRYEPDDDRTREKPRYHSRGLQGERRQNSRGVRAETENIIEHAIDKLRRKDLDLIVANNVAQQGIGFGSEENEVTIIDRSGAPNRCALSKDEIAHIILDSVKKLIKKRRRSARVIPERDASALVPVHL